MPEPAPLHVADLALFSAGSADLDAQAHRSLAPLLEKIAQHPGWLIEVRGHSDDSGSPAQNDRLADARAKAVARWLGAQGIAPACVQALSLGASQPLLANATAAGRAANRRVSIHLLPATPPCPITPPATTAAPPSPATAPPPPRPIAPAPRQQ
ncbi:OmpA family protein [Pseudomonas sp. KNUC1026]|uniref:OmpA family protein n=1 Tax=Pseudomonas sp. KNUC1026 TaxID=2893890 RepID=UPI003FA72968